MKFWLPKKQRQDIVAELSEDLRSQIEDKESEMGRQLNESEVAELLKQRGRPVLVANRYLPQQHLIGPAFVSDLRLRVEGRRSLLHAAVDSGMDRHRGFSRCTFRQSLIEAVGSFWTSFWPMAFFMVGSITTVFAVIERVQAKSNCLNQWDPRKLPPVRDPNRIPVSNSVVEVAANLVFCCWLVGGMWYQRVLHFSGITITLTPVWRYFFWGFLLLALGNATASAVNVFRPYWTWARASIRLASDAIGSVLVCWLMKADILAEISLPNVAPEKTAQIASAINWWWAKMFPFAIVACVLIAVGNAYRIIRVRSNADSGIVLNAATGVQ